jgi:hypothetical protein
MAQWWSIAVSDGEFPATRWREELRIDLASVADAVLAGPVPP